MLPDLLVDRSLGGIAVPNYLRSAWPASVRTLDEVFGPGKVDDDVWMKRADHEGWVAACKDGRIRTRKGERLLMSRGRLRAFCLPNGNLMCDVMVERFRNALPDMVEQAVHPGPWMYGVYTEGIKPLTLYHREPN